MRQWIRLLVVLFFGFIAFCPSECLGLTKGSSNPVPGQWRGLHLLNYRSDAALDGLEKDVPGLAEMGINVLILEVNYGFAYQSHPELAMGKTPITRKGARSLVNTCREHGIQLIPQFSCLGHQSWAKQTYPLLTQ